MVLEEKDQNREIWPFNRGWAYSSEYIDVLYREAKEMGKDAGFFNSSGRQRILKSDVWRNLLIVNSWRQFGWTPSPEYRMAELKEIGRYNLKTRKIA